MRVRKRSVDDPTNSAALSSFGRPTPNSPQQTLLKLRRRLGRGHRGTAAVSVCRYCMKARPLFAKG